MRLLVPLLLSAGFAADAAITVTGLSDEEVYDDSVTYTVVDEPGFILSAELDGQLYSTGSPHTVTDVDYHELVVTKYESDGATLVETETIQFIVRSTGRGNSEWGLPPFTPRPNVMSSPTELAGTSLRLVHPSSLPAGWELPVAAKIVGPDGVVRVMAEARSGDERLRLFRGAGGKHFSISGDGPTGFELSTSEDREFVGVYIEAAPAWTTAPATISGHVTWPIDSRVRISEDFTIPDGGVLIIDDGSIVEIADGIDITIEGNVEIRGSELQPVLFTSPPGSVWGGCFVSGRVEAEYLFVTRGGEDDDWFTDSGFSAHRKEQATFLFDEDSTGIFTNCFWLDNPGQPLHGKNASITLNECLVQRSPTVGQFNGGAVHLEDCHLVEFPIDSPEFADDDNDGIYFTTGDHRLTDTVVGWAKDDGIDAGSGSTGTVRIKRCWFESCFHEGLALSGGGREVNISETVSMNNGQGIECGYSTSGNSPVVDVTGSLCIGNHVGWRYGDNYDWDYNGYLHVNSSISIFNARDIWGYEWDSWDYRSESMEIADNVITNDDPRWPDNRAWGEGDWGVLAKFMAVPDIVGIGFASVEMQRPLTRYGEPIELGLSSFNSVPTGLSFEISVKEPGVPERTTITGGLDFAPGAIVESFTPPYWDSEDPLEYVRVTISDPTGAEITTPKTLVYMPVIDAADTLVAFGASWSYLDDGSDQGTAWRAPDFGDETWATGLAELGYGDDDEATELDDSSANYPTYYFRHRFTVDDPDLYRAATIHLLRDDGGIVYLNGAEVMRSNMEPGPVAHADFAADTVSNEATPDSIALDPARLVPGENVFAVEIHQANATSSDVSFDLELTAVRHSDPKLLLLPAEFGSAILVWAAPAGTVLEHSADLALWTPMSGASSPHLIEPSASGERAFYRLRSPD